MQPPGCSHAPVLKRWVVLTPPFLYGEDNNYVHRVRWHGFKLGVYPLAYIYHDRGERPPAEPDMVEAFRRSSLVNYLNPLLSNDRAKERARLTRAALGEALRGNFIIAGS